MLSNTGSIFGVEGLGEGLEGGKWGRKKARGTEKQKRIEGKITKKKGKASLTLIIRSHEKKKRRSVGL